MVCRWVGEAGGCHLLRSFTSFLSWFPCSKFTRGKKDPFFVFFYVDSGLICARGRGGGIAVWARTTPQWELEAGVV